MIEVRNEHGAARGAATVTIDGQPSDGPGIDLVDDGARHVVTVRHAAEAP
jgi:hypothetical protein